MDTHCHKLKHDSGFAKVLLAEMEIIQPKRVSKSVLEGFHDAITYFRNHHHQMHYVEAIAANLPIGSGITEAASIPTLDGSNSGIKSIAMGFLLLPNNCIILRSYPL